MSLQLTHEVFFSQPDSFLATILQLPIPKTRLNSTPLLPSSYPGRLASRNSTNSSKLNCSLYLLCTNHTENSLYYWEGVFTAPLHTNGSYSIVVCVLVAVGTCLPSCCLEMNVFSDFTIPAFGRYVTIYNTIVYCGNSKPSEVCLV
jgi:hypothetical protein